MSDPNRDLIARIARRGDDELPTQPVPIIANEDWNAPIDMTQADSMTVTKIIQGEFADLREGVARWSPRPCPPR